MNFAKHWAAVVDDYVIDLAWSPDGKLLAVASAAGGITLYDSGSGAVMHGLAGHENGANCIAWVGSDDKALLASGGQDGSVRFWNGSTGEQVAAAKLGTAWVEHLAVRSDGLLFASAGRKLVALRGDGTIAHAFPDAPKTITALVVGAPPASGGTERVSAAYFGGVGTWDAKTFSVIKEYAYGNTIHALVWSPDGRWLVAGCQDNAVHLWAPAEDVELHMSGYETKLKELSFSHDAKSLATGGGRDACVWDCTGPGPEGREPLLLPHTARVCALAFQNRHSLLATGAANGEFSLWAPSRKNPMIAEVKMPSAATKFAWRNDDSLLAVGTEKGSVFVFRV